MASALTVDALADLADAGEPMPLIPLDEAAKAALPALTLTDDEATNLSYGKPLRERKDELSKPEHDDDFTQDAAAVAPDGRVIAVVRRIKGAAKPVIVFHPGGQAS